MNSYAESIEVPCATCQRAVQGKLWLIVDTVERPDLVKQIQRGKLHRVVCPDCGQVAAAPDQPLLIYRPEAEPVLLFSPAQGTSQEEDRAAAARLVAQLQERLGDQWQDDWGEELPAIPRPIVPQVLAGNLEQAVQQMQAEIQQAAAELQQQMTDPPAGLPALAALAELLIETFVKAQTWDESQRVVAQHPELLTEPADWVLAQLISAQEEDGARRVLQEHRELLQRCRQVGIEPAFQEKTGRNSTAGRQVPTELRPLLQRLKQLNRPTDHPERIQILRQALIQVTQADNPQLWAALQGELGNSYAQSFQGQRFQNIEDAITAYQQSLTVRTQAAMPVEWAQTMNNLAIAYRNRIRGDKAQNIEDAITAYQQSLTVITPTTNPYDCLIAARGLGNLHFTRGNWQLALDEGYRRAIQAVEQTRTWASSDERKQEVLENAIGVYDNALQCHINLGQYDAAILLTERARSRHLVDLMASNDAYKSGNIPADVLMYLEQYEDLQQRINAERQRQQNSDTKALSATTKRVESMDALKITREEIEFLYAEKDRIWQQLRQLDPVLAGQLEVSPLDFATLSQLIDRPGTALLSFYSTNDHTYIFILRQSGVTVHTCTNQGYRDLQTWVRDHWLRQYNTQDKVRFNQWLTNMPSLLQNLANRLQLDVLIHQHLQGIDELILIPHIFLHVIPFAALPLPAGCPLHSQAATYLGDAFRLRIVPSAQVLHYCQQRPPQSQLESLGVVEDASDDLICARYECDEIIKLQPVATHYRLQGSSQATIAAYRRLTQEQKVQALHSSHHASSVLGKPLESALALGDGLITLAQLMSPGWRMPDLVEVFLSCCETALGTPTITDDILTLSAGFLCAGARSVISTLWSVDQLATAIFCIRYYHHRQSPDCDDLPTALQRAQQDLRTLPGSTLDEQYKPLMKLYLQHLQDEHPQLIAQAKALQQQKEHAQQAGDQAQVKDLRKRLKDLDAQVKRNRNLHTYLPTLVQQSTPFASPFYWAAFTCQGLR